MAKAGGEEAEGSPHPSPQPPERRVLVSLLGCQVVGHEVTASGCARGGSGCTSGRVSSGRGWSSVEGAAQGSAESLEASKGRVDVVS